MVFSKGEMVTCTGCNNQIGIKSAFSDLVVCSACGHVITKKAGALSTKVLPIPEDMSVIQVGTHGILRKKQQFEIIGRYKIDAEDGYYNLWCIMLADSGTLEWIIDSFGEYVLAVSKPALFETIDLKFWDSDCNANVELAGIGLLKLVAKPKVTEQNMEGELPQMPDAIVVCKVYELADEQGRQALLIRQKDDKLVFIIGDTLNWDLYHFENTRKVETIGN